MLHFFSKTKFLVDFLEGMVDIHSHILPGIDDGAQTVHESVQMIKMFQEFGINELVCTPHIMHNYYDNTPTTVEEAYRKLLDSLITENIQGVTVKYAAEHMIDDDFENKLEENLIIPLNENHLLIEMSYLQPSINFDSAVEKIVQHGFFPVFAHPERYQYLNSDIANYMEFKSQGIKFQLNLLSLGGYYGADAQKAAFQLLEGNFYEFLGSDAHNLRHLTALKSIKLKECYAANLLRLIHNNRMLV